MRRRESLRRRARRPEQQQRGRRRSRESLGAEDDQGVPRVTTGAGINRDRFGLFALRGLSV